MTVVRMRKRTKDYFGIKRDILKVEGTEFDVLAHGKSEGLEGNIMTHCLQVQVSGNVNATETEFRRLGFRGEENNKEVSVALCHLFPLSHFLA